MTRAPATLLKLVPSLLLTANLLIGSAYGDENHPINRFYEACVDKDPSTAGMIECAEKAHEMWDDEMNKVYGKLLKKLPAKDLALLKKSQRDWLVQRDSEFRFMDAIYSKLEGTMYLPMHADARLRVVRERTLLLTNYLELIQQQE